jgi:hypothetical protein
MYGDKNLEFSVASRDAAATTTRALPMGQGDLSGDTAGMGTYGGLFVYASAGEDIPIGLVITMQHSDKQNGTFESLATFPATTIVKSIGDELIKYPVPLNVKNWVRFTLSSAVKANIVMTTDVDKWINGLVGGH